MECSIIFRALTSPYYVLYTWREVTASGRPKEKENCGDSVIEKEIEEMMTEHYIRTRRIRRWNGLFLGSLSTPASNLPIPATSWLARGLCRSPGSSPSRRSSPPRFTLVVARFHPTLKIRVRLGSQSEDSNFEIVTIKGGRQKARSLLYGEMLAYWVPSLWSCSWPHLNSPSTSTMGNDGDQDGYVKVAVLADPQLMDRTSLGLPPKSFALEMVQFYTDLFMHRAYLSSILPFKPDVVLFLGDYFDGGPYLSDEEWQDSLSRFKHIFDLKTQGKHTECPVYYIPGNHDVGYASLHSNKPEVLSRYEREFGKRNHRFTVGKVDFIAVDAQTLDGIQLEGKASSSWDLVKNVSLGSHSNPRVLLTHIPLYRHDWTYCGSNRNSPVINQRIRRTTANQEIAYQNYITEESSNYLLDLVKPVLVLSAHDHDQCSVVHKAKFGNVVEHTVGTVSWQQGNLHPSFMLLSVSNVTMLTASNPREAVLTQLCFLPMQTHIYIWYLLLLIATLLALLFWPTSSKSLWHQIRGTIGHCMHLISSNLSGGATKEKNEDENFVYEEIWDAEGTMHLIKKSLDGPTMSSSDRGPVVRGSAVIRPTAKMHNQDVEVSMDVDTSSDVGSSVKLALKTSKSRTTFVVQRLVRTLWMFTVIAAVNVPLYMMLLFKDWNDV